MRGLVRQHIDSFDYFINHDIKKIVRAKGNQVVRSDSDPNFYLRWVSTSAKCMIILVSYLRNEEDMPNCACRIHICTPACRCNPLGDIHSQCVQVP